MKTVSPEQMALDAYAAMDDQRRIDFATGLILNITAPNLVHRLEVAANLIGRHAHKVACDATPRRSDGTAIHPYAPDGGPLRRAG